MRLRGWRAGPGPALFFAILTFLLRLVAFALDRLENLALGPDGGWSLALASLGPGRLLDLLAREIHPPFYYLLLHCWQLVAGSSGFAAKYLSLIPSVLAVALVYQVGRQLGGRAAGLWAAFMLAVMPLHLLFAGVVRDASLTVLLILASSHAFLRLLPPSRGEQSSSRGYAAWGWYLVVTLAGLYTSYLFVFLPAAQGLYLLVFRWQRESLTKVAVAWVMLLIGYVPWLARIAPEWLGALEQGSALVRAEPRLLHPLDYLPRVVKSLAVGSSFPLSPWLALGGYAIILGAGLGLNRRRRAELGFIGLALGLGVLFIYGVASLARGQGEEIAPRYIMMLAPLFVLIVACAVESIAAGRVAIGGLLALPFIVMLLLGLGAFLNRPPPAPSLWNPRGLVRYLDERAGAGDGVVFTSLGQAGYYLGWSQRRLPWYYMSAGGDIYLGRDMAGQVAVILPPAVAKHRALWLVLYQGLTEKAALIKNWLDGNAFVADAEWRDDSLVYLYASSGGELERRELGADFADGIRLRAVEMAPQAVEGDYICLILYWEATAPPRGDYTVFVHLVDDQGRRWAQHDSPPVNGSAPTSGWVPGRPIEDRRALWLPEEMEAGDYRVEVGLYSERGRLGLKGGGEVLTLGEVVIE